MQLASTKVNRLPANLPTFGPPNSISRMTDITGDRRRLDVA